MVATLDEFKQAFSVASSPSVAPSPRSASRPVAQSPAPGSRKREKDRLDQMVDEALGDAEKRAKALLTWKVPKFSEEYKKAPELDKYFADLESGIAKVREHVKFVSDVVGYVEKYGNPELLEGIGDSVKRVKAIAERIDKGVGKIQTTIDAVKNVREFAKTAGKFVGATEAMDPKDPESVRKWAESMQDLWDSGAGYMEWLQNKQLVTRAMQGSKLAGAMAATLPIVTAQFAVGLEALKAGLKNVNAYMNRLKKWEQIIDEQTRGRPAAPPPPPPPDPPLAWVSMEDQEASAVWMEDDRLRSAIQAEGAEKLNAATQEFEKTVFPKIYKSTVRPQIVDVIAKSKKAFAEKRRAAEAKQAAFPGRFERTEKRLATARASVQKLEDEDPNHPRLADLRKLRDDYDAELTAITLEWEKFEKTEEPFLVGLHIVNRQFDEWDGILRGDEQSQVYGFQRLENEGRGFPVFHQVHDAELDKHLQAAAAEHRKEVAKKLGVGAR